LTTVRKLKKPTEATETEIETVLSLEYVSDEEDGIHTNDKRGFEVRRPAWRYSAVNENNS
jgi:hypothetical protein